MARYIDADIVGEEIDELQNSLMSNNDIIWRKNKPIYKGLCYARGIINDTPTADVVPRAEVEQWKILVKDQRTRIDELNKSKAELAREIFEEIENALSENFHADCQMGDCIEDYYDDNLRDDIAELKKKYTEEKKDEKGV